MNSTATMPMAPVFSLWPDCDRHLDELAARHLLARHTCARLHWDRGRGGTRFAATDRRMGVTWFTPSGTRLAPAAVETQGRRIEIVCFRFVLHQTIDTTVAKGMHSWLNQLSQGSASLDAGRTGGVGDRLRRVLLRGQAGGPRQGPRVLEPGQDAVLDRRGHPAGHRPARGLPALGHVGQAPHRRPPQRRHLQRRPPQPRGRRRRGPGDAPLRHRQPPLPLAGPDGARRGPGGHGARRVSRR